MNKNMKITIGVIVLIAIGMVACAVPQGGNYPTTPTASAPVVQTVVARETVQVQATVMVRETVVVRETAVPPTVAPTNASTDEPTRTPEPTAAPPQPAASGDELTNVPPGGPFGLKYQHDAGCSDVGDKAMDYPACILQKVQSGEMTGEQAVKMIQQLSVKYQAHNEDKPQHVLPNTQPALFWCPGGVTAPYPPDTARPLEGTKGAKWANLLFVVDRATGGPDRVVNAKSGTKCWMVYRR